MPHAAELTRRALLTLAATAAATACSSGQRSDAAISTASPVPVTGPSLSALGEGARTSSGTVPKLWVQSRSRQGRVERWVLGTDVVEGRVEVNVLLPSGYDRDPTKHYPVLFLLHGSSSTATSWLDAGVENLVGDREVIVVMPFGGEQGWYVDWASTDVVARWESLHVLALVPAVDSVYRTLGRARGRAVAGMSMGGFGAVHYAEAYPDLFGAVTSLSGPLDLRHPRDLAALDAQELPGKPAYAIFGRDDAAARVQQVDPPQHVGGLAGRRVRLYCGDGRTPTGDDADEQAFLGANRSFVDVARSAGVDIALEVLPGGHSFDVWGPAFAKDLPGLLSALDSAQ